MVKNSNSVRRKRKHSAWIQSLTLPSWGWSTAEDVFFCIESDSAAGNYGKTGFLSKKMCKTGEPNLPNITTL